MSERVDTILALCMKKDGQSVLDASDFSAGEITELRSRLRQSGFRLVAINLEHHRGKDAILNALDIGLEFPDYFGYNWDALDECLSDLDWLGEVSGIVALLYPSSELETGDLSVFGHLVDTFEAANAYRMSRGAPPLRLIKG